MQQEGKFGAGDGARTRDLELGKLRLYQLSYARSLNGSDSKRFSTAAARKNIPRIRYSYMSIWDNQYGSMGTMKTTVEISDALMQEAKRVASKEETTLRQLIEEGLRRALEDRKQHRRFRLRRESFKGKGLQPGIAPGTWERIRDLIYEGRGA